MTTNLHGAFWPKPDLGPALAALARHLGVPASAGSIPISEAGGTTPNEIDATCAHLGLECEQIILYGNTVAAALRASAPAVIPVDEFGWLVVAEARGLYLHLFTPEPSVRKVSIADVRSALCSRHEEPHRSEAERMLGACGIKPPRMPRAVDALVETRMHRQSVGTVFAVSVPPGADFFRQLRNAGVLRWFVLMLVAHAAEYALLIAAWTVIGRAALLGRVDPGWLIAWMLLLATMVPCRMLTTWAQGVLAVRAGGLLRQRVLAGILQLKPEEVRHEGAGAFLARAIDTEMVESLALSGGLASLLALVELIVAALVLAAGSALLELPLLGLWCGLTAFLAWRYTRARRTWTDARLTMTHEQVERMVGHRSRLAQQPRGEWHLDEDRRLEAYLAASQEMDARAAQLEGLIPRGWFFVGLLALAPTFLSAQIDPTGLAISLGGVLLGWRALRRLTTGLASLSGAILSWERIAPLFHAAARREAPAPCARSPQSPAIIEARDLAYQYSNHAQSVLRGLELEVSAGEKLLVQGRSGGGKSTLVSLLAGLRQPTSGLLLSGGLDRATLGGARWHRRISAAPQYHDNHVFTGPLAYNLLLARGWPPRESDLREAEEVARDAGLGPLLDRMPGGLMQMVGETGWQLSSGERSRVFLCRALLSRAELVILDESFAALDPVTLRQSLECSWRRAKSLMVVAHP